MSRKVDASQMDQIDEILKTEDPEFVKGLEEINSHDLKLADLEAAFNEAEKSNTRVKRFWDNATPIKRWSLVGVSTLILLSPVFYLVWYYFLKPPPLGEMASLELISEATYTFDRSLPPKSLFDAFIGETYFLEIHDQVFYLREKRDIRMGRIGLYLEVSSKEDLEKAEKERDAIIEVLNSEFAKSDIDDFNGVVGKNNVKKRLLISLNQKVEVKIKNVRFSLLVFN